MSPVYKKTLSIAQSQTGTSWWKSPVILCTVVVITIAIALLLILCLHKRRKRDMQRRRELVESLRSGEDSSDCGDMQSGEPDNEGEPEDIRELFYFYWRQGKTQAANRQAKSVELQSKVHDRVQKERSGPRRQTFSGDGADRIRANDRPFNPEVLFGGIQPRKMSSGGRNKTDAHNIVRCSQPKLRRAPETEISIDENSTTVCVRRSNEQDSSSVLCENPTSATSDRSSVTRQDSQTKVEQIAGGGFSGESCTQSHNEIRNKSAPIQIPNSIPTQHRQATNPSYETPPNQSSSFIEDGARPNDLDLTRYIINTNDARRLRRLNSCPEAESCPSIGERSWSFSSLVIAWDFKKTSVINDVEFEDV